MSEYSKALAVRALFVAWMGAIGLSTPSTASNTEIRFECKNTYCSETCSVINCVADAECAPSGSCAWDPAAGCMRVTCDQPE